MSGDQQAVLWSVLILFLMATLPALVIAVWRWAL